MIGLGENNVYASQSEKKHTSLDDVFLGGGNFMKSKRDYSENYYNGHWDENYIDRYQSGEQED